MGCRELQLNNQFFFVDSDEKEPHPCKFVFIRGSEEFQSTVTNRKTRTYSANTDTAYQYDLLGRLAGVNALKQGGESVNDLATYSYTAVGSRAGIVNVSSGSGPSG